MKVKVACHTLDELLRSIKVDHAPLNPAGDNILLAILNAPTSWREPFIDMLLRYLTIWALVNVEAKFGRSPLSWAAENVDFSLSLVEILIEVGAEINTRSNDGRTPLSYTAGQSREAVVRVLNIPKRTSQKTGRNGRRCRDSCVWLRSGGAKVQRRASHLGSRRKRRP